MAEAFAEAGLPDGVLQLVHGDGPTTGEALVTHPVPAKVSFTGQPAGRPPHPAGGRAQARDARARQQLRHDRRARRRPRGRDPALGDVGVRQRRAGLHQPPAALRARGDRRTVHRARSWRHTEALQGRQPPRSRHRRRADDLGRRGGSRRGVDPGGGRGRRDDRDRRPPRGTAALADGADRHDDPT